MKTKTLYPHFPLLIVDDEKPWLNSLSLTMRTEGISNIECCSDSRQVLSILSGKQYTALILDLIMPHTSGEELLPEITQLYPDMPIVVTTALDQVETAVKCMRLGAFDYQVKGNEEGKLIGTIKRAIEVSQLRQENTLLKDHFLHDRINHPEIFAAIVTGNKLMRSIFQYIEAIAHTPEPVLITGETGVGKELFAQALHKISDCPGEFVPVNIAGLDKEIFSDTLFGHKKGAFTGAEKNRTGLLAKASGGSIFLDEIGDLDQASQIKLLRLIQEKEYSPLGSDLAKKTDARMIFATLRNIKTLQDTKIFRSDLFYRLRTHHIQIPPLRERLDDIPILLDYFIKQSSAQLGKKVPTYPGELITLLETYHYPGNIRELKNMVFDAISKHQTKTLSLAAFKEYLNNDDFSADSIQNESDETNTIFSGLTKLPSLKQAHSYLVKEAMHRSKENQSIAADMLGITRQALNWRLKKGKN